MAKPFMSPTLPEELPDDPLTWAKAWLDEARSQGVRRNPNAMTLATVASSGKPSMRVVLCKEFLADPGYIVFHTNYRSQKVIEIDSNPNVAVTFHWDALGRQIRLEGLAVLSPKDESDSYFASRNWGSQLGAWGSDQSKSIETREALIDQLRERAQQIGVRVSDDLQTLLEEAPLIHRPPHWGGIRVWPHTVELWLEGADRIHDRARWSRSMQPAGKHDYDVGHWSGTRLQP